MHVILYTKKMPLKNATLFQIWEEPDYQECYYPFTVSCWSQFSIFFYISWEKKLNELLIYGYSKGGWVAENYLKWLKVSVFYYFLRFLVTEVLQAITNLLPDCELGSHGNRGLKARCSARDNRRGESGVKCFWKMSGCSTATFTFWVKCTKKYPSSFFLSN